MKKHIIITACLLSATVVGASAQTYSGYFLEDYTHRYKMNPAFGNEETFIGIPGINNVNSAMRGNLRLTDVFYNLDGRTVLFTNPGISEGEAMKKFGNHNKLEAGVNIELLSGGFKAWGGYNTVSFGVRANAGVNVPKELFSLAKEGISNQTYDIKDLGMQARAFGQIALNHSRDIKQLPGLRVGAALKFYLGAINIDGYFDKAQLRLGENSWTATTQGNIYASASGMKFKMKRNDDTGRDYIDGIDYKFKGLDGFGIGFDLGACYKWRDFNFSLAVLDLGFISWGKTQWAAADGEEINTDSYHFNANEDAPNSFKNEWERFRDDLSGLYQFSDKGELSSRTRAMAATINVGVEYELPAYRPLHFGFLSSTVINGAYTWSQARFSANVKPVKWVSASASLEASTFGVGFGWLVNFYPKGVNIFIGMDHTMGKLAKQGIPLNSNGSMSLGFNVHF